MEKQLRKHVRLRDVFIAKAKEDKVGLENSDYLTCLNFINQNIEKIRLGMIVAISDTRNIGHEDLNDALRVYLENGGKIQKQSPEVGVRMPWLEELDEFDYFEGEKMEIIMDKHNNYQNL